MKKTLLIFSLLVFTFFLGGCLHDKIYLTEQTRNIPSITTTSSPQKLTDEEKIDFQASFAIFSDGLFRDFSAAMYHNRSADVFIAAPNSNVIRITKKGISWNDFFSSMPSPFKLTKDCLITGTGQDFCTSKSGGSLKFYLNGVKSENLLDLEINDIDKVLITYGNETESQIKRQLDQIPDPKLPMK